LAEMIGTTRSRVSFFMNKFRKLGLISYNGKIEVHSSLLSAVLHDKPEIKRDESTDKEYPCTPDPDSRLYRKAAGREAKLCYMGHATRENRHGLAVAGIVTQASGTAERRASEIMLKARIKAAGRRIRPVRTRRMTRPIMSPIFAPWT
jgi:hypothetical protein